MTKDKKSQKYRIDKEKVLRQINNGKMVKEKELFLIDTNKKIDEVNASYEKKGLAYSIDKETGFTNRIEKTNNEKEPKEKIICSFFVDPLYRIVVDKYYEKENYVVLKLYSLKNKVKTVTKV